MTESARAPGGAEPPAQPRGPTGPRRIGTGVALLLLPGLALCLLYAPALDYNYAWTDTSAIGGRSMLRPPGEITQAFHEPLHRIAHRGAAAQQSYYRPLQVAALSWVDQQLGSEPRNFRGAALGVGFLCLAIWAWFAGRLLGNPGAGLVAALFVASHPVGIESYVWIAGSSGALCAIFVLVALALGLAACRPRSLPGFAALSLLSLGGLATALLAKERAVVEPALLLALFATHAVREGAGRAGGPPAELLHRPRAAALFLLHVALVAVYVFAWRPVILGASHFTLPPIGGSWLQQLASAVANWPSKLAWLFLPLHSTTSDVIRIVKSPSDAYALAGVALALLSLVGFWLCLRRGRSAVALGLAWIWIAYAPTAGLLPQLHANGERYLFLSVFGASLIVADLVALLFRRVGRTAGIAAAVVVLAFLAQRTSARIPEWESNLGLFQQEIARDPAYREGYFLVAMELFEQQRFAEADKTLRPLLGGGERFDGTDSYLNLLSVNELACSLAFARRRYDDVLALEKRLEREQPALLRVAPIRTCIGQAYDALGETRRAVELFTAVADELGPTTPPPLYLMIARGHLRLRELDRCREWLERARATAGNDPSLTQQIREIEKRVRRRAGGRPTRDRR